MRLWSIHPRYLDTIGLVALWREGLLARRVLQGRTRGYRHHPQLVRFRAQRLPLESINCYLESVWNEACRRGYSFDRRKLRRHRRVRRIPVSSGQLRFELRHLRRKLRIRNIRQYRSLERVKEPAPHPLFRVQKGPVEEWERR